MPTLESTPLTPLGEPILEYHLNVGVANNRFGEAALGEIDRTLTSTRNEGGSIQATNTDQFFGHKNHFVVGASIDVVPCTSTRSNGLPSHLRHSIEAAPSSTSRAY